ncbi:MAG: phosphoribosylamine--glycine ligase [Bdellovibrionales bacterium]|jgi:phosphoribosylamine--glycine ligase|nr:phosphoribosylamine--glycine ligase [Bdellovibrionales bacterium]
MTILPKRILVIGQGGREHAIVRQLALETSVETVYALPGSDGMKTSDRIQTIAMNVVPENFEQILRFAKEHAVELIVVGPEQPLADGFTDLARAQGLRVFGPSGAGALLEASKVHAKELMRAAGVLTARSFTVSTVDECMEAAKSFAPPYVLKADGLAAGKGVFIEKTLEGLKRAAHFLFEEKGLGEAGHRALLEEFSPGVELSHLVLTDGDSFVSMPAARDHKRLCDGDEGPNTGGMGVVAPVPLEEGLLEKIERDVVAPVIREIKKRGLVFRGVLYVGLMLTKDGPSVLEFNTRFGDPEAQVLMPLLDSESGPGWNEVLTKTADGELQSIASNVRWLEHRAIACIVLAAEKYPDKPVKGVAISGLDEKGRLEDAHAYALHAGTNRRDDGRFATNGGRVLNVIAYADDASNSSTVMSEAIRRAYAGTAKISWPGMQLRKDIGRSLTTSSEG